MTKEAIYTSSCEKHGVLGEHLSYVAERTAYLAALESVWLHRLSCGGAGAVRVRWA